MTSWAIVAVPEDGESVWKVSSEKVPHMTLLFLGEQSDPSKAEHIAQYLQHAVNRSIFKFGAEVRNRGVLGDESADVLFFEANERLKMVNDFRSFLLADTTINEAYHSTTQFDGWTPHLTLGYPAKPAKKVEGLHSLPFYSVYFDKIALWVDDYDGPTFNLEYPDQQTMAMDSLAHRQAERASAHQQPETARDVVMRNVLTRRKLREPSNLKHHGIGARKFEHRNLVEEAANKTLKAAAETSKALSHEGRFLKHAISGELVHGSTTEAKQVYVRENQLAFLRHFEQTIGGRPSERDGREFDISTRPDGDWLLSRIDRLSHTATVETCIRPELDERGMITGYDIVHDQLTPDDMRCALMHYGVKGMKWGVRRKNPSEGGSSSGGGSGSSGSGNAGPGSSNKSDKTRAEKRADKKAQRAFDRKAAVVKPTKSEEAKTAAVARKRSEKHGTDLLTNKELQDMVTRMNLEQQYQNLMDNKKSQSARSAGTKYVGNLLLDIGTSVVKDVATDYLKSTIEDAMSGGSSNSNSNNSPNRPSWIRNEANDLPSPPPRPLPWNRQRQLT
ncbi:hydrolase [Gordonia phage Burley]|nr:hydrolase [Gordonia phage Burley]